MSLVLDPNRPWTDEEKDWCRSTGRAYMIETNERRFPGGKASKAAKNEKAGAPPESAQFGAHGEMARQAAVYDVGGVALPGTTLDYDTGRALQFDAEGNGITVEPSPPLNAPGAFAPAIVQDNEGLGFNSYSDQGDDIDDDIVETVLGYKTKAEVQTALNEANEKAPAGFRQEWTKNDDRETLNDKLALVLQDTRHPEKAAEARQLAQRTQPPAVEGDEEQGSMLEQNLGSNDDFEDTEASPASGEGDDNASQEQNDGPETDAKAQKSSKK